jgi:hypothetical protein
MAWAAVAAFLSDVDDVNDVHVDENDVLSRLKNK